MKETIKILHLIPELYFTCGITKTIFSIISGLDKTYEQHVLTFGGEAVEYFRNSNIKVNVINGSTELNIWKTLLVFTRIFKYISNNNIYVVHSHHRYFDFITFLISKLIRIKTITSVQSIVINKKLISYNSQILIAASNSVREHLIKYFKVDKTKIVVINNFVDSAKMVLDMNETDFAVRNNLDNRYKKILFIGRIDLEKGIDILIRCFEKIQMIFPKVELLILGDGRLKDWVSREISRKKLNVRLFSPVSNPSNFYKIVDIVVLPSRVDPFPLVMLEAGYFNKAFIGASVDGIKELIVNGRDGLLFEKENINMLCINIKKLLNDSRLRISIANNLHKKIINNFTEKSIIQKYKNIYLRCSKTIILK